MAYTELMRRPGKDVIEATPIVPPGTPPEDYRAAMSAKVRDLITPHLKDYTGTMTPKLMDAVTGIAKSVRGLGSLGNYADGLAGRGTAENPGIIAPTPDLANPEQDVMPRGNVGGTRSGAMSDAPVARPDEAMAYASLVRPESPGNKLMTDASGRVTGIQGEASKGIFMPNSVEGVKQMLADLNPATMSPAEVAAVAAHARQILGDNDAFTAGEAARISAGNEYARRFMPETRGTMPQTIPVATNDLGQLTDWLKLSTDAQNMSNETAKTNIMGRNADAAIMKSLGAGENQPYKVGQIVDSQGMVTGYDANGRTIFDPSYKKQETTSTIPDSMRATAESNAKKIHEGKALLKDFGNMRNGSISEMTARAYSELYPDESLSDRIANNQYMRSTAVQGQVKILKSVAPVLKRVYDSYAAMGATENGGPLDTLYNWGNERYKTKTGSPAAAALKQAKFDLEREVLRGLTQVGAITDTAAAQFEESYSKAANLAEIAAVNDALQITVNARLLEMNKGINGSGDNLLGGETIDWRTGKTVPPVGSGTAPATGGDPIANGAAAELARRRAAKGVR